MNHRSLRKLLGIAASAAVQLSGARHVLEVKLFSRQVVSSAH